MMADRTRTRRALRDAAFAGKGAGSPPGRPPGARPLKEDDRRFEIAVFGWLRRTRLNGKGESFRAAEIAASVFGRAVATTVSTITTPEGHEGLSFLYKGGLGEIVTTRARGKRRHDAGKRGDARKNRIEKIRREAPKLIKNATGMDRAWLEASMLALDTWFNAMATGNLLALRGAIEVLQRLGWTERLQKLFPKPALDQ
jgi:hypothetical protein